MQVWLPYTATNSGSTVFMNRLGEALRERCIKAVVSEYPHHFQYAPFLLRNIKPPLGTTAVITNSWSGFAFHRRDLISICVEHLFVLDEALLPYKSYPQSVFHRRFLTPFISRSYESSDHVVAVSAYTGEAMQRVFKRAQPKIIRNGVDTDFFTPSTVADSVKRSARPFRLGFAGNPTRRKGADLLPAIMKRLGVGFELLHTGDVMTGIDLTVEGRFKPKGRLDAEGMREFYRECDALLAPTRLEGLPLTVIEAQACGLPVICTNSTSLPEAVSDGKTGIICPVDDEQAMASAAKKLADNPPLRQEMARAARDRTVSEFGFSDMVDAYVALLGVRCG